MTNKNYQRGRAYEYRIKKKLEAEGWTVLRTAGSHGEFDLVAIKPGRALRVTYPDIGPLEPPIWKTLGSEIKLIQCKTGKTKKKMIKEIEKTDIKKYEGLYSVTVEMV